MSGSEYLLWSYEKFEKMTFFPPDPLMEGRPSTKLWRYLLTKIASTLDIAFINSGFFFIPKVMLPPTTTSDSPPLPWCEPNTHLKSMCF